MLLLTCLNPGQTSLTCSTVFATLQVWAGAKKSFRAPANQTRSTLFSGVFSVKPAQDREGGHYTHNYVETAWVLSTVLLDDVFYLG